MTVTATTSIFNSFQHEPTQCQSRALYLIEQFLEKSDEFKAFVLTGSAGTGKTSLMQAVVTYLDSQKLNIALLAPTSKAASVLSRRTNEMASTIHSGIYLAEELPDGKIKFLKRVNDVNVRTVFIVDEASMLQAQREEKEDFLTPNPLLEDLLDFVKQGHENNQVIFIGDTYQLPPVGEDYSVALSPKDLFEKYKLSVMYASLRQVMRQANQSPILTLANIIKERNDNQENLKRIPLYRLADERGGLSYFMQHFSLENLNKVIFIALSNAKVNELNNSVRVLRGLNSRSLMPGDVVMAHRNWKNKEGQVVNKGDVGKVLSIDAEPEKLVELTFVNAKIEFNGFVVETKVLIDSLLSSKGDIERTLINFLKNNRMIHNRTYRESKRASDDAYMNAIHLRYGYAITCHKAQGSEWERVLIEPHFYLSNHRWLYTAVTRASQEVKSWWY